MAIRYHLFCIFFCTISSDHSEGLCKIYPIKAPISTWCPEGLSAPNPWVNTKNSYMWCYCSYKQGGSIFIVFYCVMIIVTTLLSILCASEYIVVSSHYKSRYFFPFLAMFNFKMYQDIRRFSHTILRWFISHQLLFYQMVTFFAFLPFTFFFQHYWSKSR